MSKLSEGGWVFFIYSCLTCIFHCRERMSRLLLPFADQQIEISSLTAGNIALTVGLKKVIKNVNPNCWFVQGCMKSIHVGEVIADHIYLT